MEIFIAKEAEIQGVTVVDDLFLSEYMPKAPEGYVKVYLFGLMQCKKQAPERDIGGALGMDEGKIAAAYRYWRELGLVEAESGEVLRVTYKNITGTVPKLAVPKKHGDLIEALNRELGMRMLTGEELTKVYDWVEVFGLSEGTVVMLVKHCLDRAGQRVSIRYMDAAAKALADAQAYTPEAAEEYFKRGEALSSGAQKILARFEIKRRATADELAMYEKWTGEWGFGENTILEVCTSLAGVRNPSFLHVDNALDCYRRNGAVSQAALSEFLAARDRAEDLAAQLYHRSGMKSVPNKDACDQADNWLNVWRMPPELILLAGEYARGASRPFAMVRTLVEEWHAGNITTLSAAREAYGKRGQKAEKPQKKPRSLAYPQRKYTEDELKHIGVKLLDEDEL